MNKYIADCAPDQYNDKRTDVVPNVNCGLFFNAGSLIGKLNDLHDFIYNRQPVPVIVGIVETWLYKDLPDTCLNVLNFTILRFDRPSKGGGVLLLINSNFNIISSKCYYLLVPFKYYCVMLHILLMPLLYLDLYAYTVLQVVIWLVHYLFLLLLKLLLLR